MYLGLSPRTWAWATQPHMVEKKTGLPQVLLRPPHGHPMFFCLSLPLSLPFSPLLALPLPLLLQTHVDTHTKCKSSFLFFYLNSTLKIVTCPFCLLMHIFKITYLNLNSLPTPLETKESFFKLVLQLHFIFLY